MSSWNARTAVRYALFYVFHGILFLSLCFAILFHFRPQDLDKSAILSTIVLIVWTIYNSPALPKVTGHGMVRAYRAAFVRRFGLSWKVWAVVLIVVGIWGGLMVRELWSRWTYVDLIKRMTFDESQESVPLATAEDLSAAFNLYPHRREVPFLLVRMSRLLAFDDQPTNFNLFVKAFLARIDQSAVLRRYSDQMALEQYEGALDPVVYLARLIVDADAASPASVERALAILSNGRGSDEFARVNRLVLQHEMASPSSPPDRPAIERLKSTRGEMREAIADIKGRVTTSHVFQEMLDHYAQVHVQLADLSQPAAEASSIVGLYGRILTMRKHIANSADVPWLDGPGRLTLYHFFKHRTGRESEISRNVLRFYAQVPGLVEALDRQLVQAEAFKEYRTQETWDRGTPLNGAFSGSGMNAKLRQWLKTGW
jgi:hypothetical protein